LIDKKSEGILKNHQSFAEPFPKLFPKHLHTPEIFQMDFGIQQIFQVYLVRNFFLKPPEAGNKTLSRLSSYQVLR
jgi:hypothetical protein